MENELIQFMLDNVLIKEVIIAIAINWLFVETVKVINISEDETKDTKRQSYFRNYYLPIKPLLFSFVFTPLSLQVFHYPFDSYDFLFYSLVVGIITTSIHQY